MIDMSGCSDDHAAHAPRIDASNFSVTNIFEKVVLLLETAQIEHQCPPSIRPITGTGSARNAAARSASARPLPRCAAGRIASPALGIVSVGMAPEPIWLSQSTHLHTEKRAEHVEPSPAHSCCVRRDCRRLRPRQQTARSAAVRPADPDRDKASVSPRWPRA